MNNLFSDFVYSLREANKLRKFRRMIRQGVMKCEPRYRCILSLNEDFEPGSVEYAHVSRYRLAAPKVTGKVLNAACGSGYGNQILAEAGCTPVGVDLFDEPLEIARKYFSHGEYLQCDVQQLHPFSDNEFDAVVSFETLEHVADPEKAVSAFKRVLKPGAVFVGSIPVMVFHNPGTNFTWPEAQFFVENHFPGAQQYIQTNHDLVPLSDHTWRSMRGSGDKYLLWVWRNE